jgi:hypothetical protein
VRHVATSRFLILAVLFLSGCTGMRTAPSSPTHQPLTPSELDALEGVWVGQGRIPMNGRQHAVSIVAALAPGGVALDVGPFRGGLTIRTQLEPTGSLQGKAWFDVEGLTVRAARPLPPGFADAVVRGVSLDRVSMKRDQRNGLILEILPAESAEPGPVGLRVSSFHLSLVTPPPAGNTRHYSRFGPYIYADWRHRDADLAYAGSSSPLRRVGEDITFLRNKGWQCLAQARRYVSAERPSSVEFNSSLFSPPLFLVFSSNPRARLVWGARTTGYIRLQHNGVSYPVAQNESGAGGTTFDFQVVPEPGTGSPSTEVLIFHFGASLGDYGSGCDVTPFGIENRRTSGEYLRALGKILVAVSLEGVRREAVESGNVVLELLAETGRDATIESTLRDLAPDASDAEIGYFTRWAALVASRDLTGMSIIRETAKEYLTQLIRQDAPEFGGSDFLIDLIVDLHIDKMTGG